MHRSSYIDANRYAIGTHLVVSRNFYTHHGIYIGPDQVIENLLDDGIVVVNLKTFAQGSVIRVREHPHPKFNGLEAVERAMSRLGEKDYSLATFNCEHFVNWCIEGVETSRQVDLCISLTSPLHHFLENIPVVGEYTKLAKQKAMAGHLATHPHDYETSAHFDRDIQLKHLKEDAGLDDVLAVGAELIYEISSEFSDNQADIERYCETDRISKKYGSAKSLNDFYDLVTQDALQERNRKRQQEASYQEHSTSLQPAANVVSFDDRNGSSFAQNTGMHSAFADDNKGVLPKSGKSRFKAEQAQNQSEGDVNPLVLKFKRSF